MSEKISTRNGFGNGLLREAEEREDFIVMDADLAKSTRGGWFRDEYPERWINVGISEQDLFATAAGIAETGRPVFANTFAIFSERGFEQVRQQIARPKRNVTVVGSHAGVITGEDGPSAQTIEDISAYRGLPNLRVISPADAVEANALVTALADDDDPAYLRLIRESVPVIHDEDEYEPTIGEGEILRDGSDVTLMAHGAMVHVVQEAAEVLAEDGIDARVVNMSTIKPLDEELVVESAEQTGAILTAEDHNIYGGLGSAVAEVLAEQRPTPMKRVGIEDEFGTSGNGLDLYEYYGFTGEDIAETAKGLLE
ncbi:transketolase family protein [Halorhabdus amylolytica]|uniref:transketolase family protein n=1 Tax=Halorhabdus amylolytica TaxID=2559573 RepID=UPI0010AA3A52|nr:transketolase C-terminal domain-containing protein [Halorhabdus amylolytica]